MSSKQSAIQKAKTIKIGTRDLATITQEEVLQVVMIEGCCAHLNYWNAPEITDFTNTMFSDCVVIDYYSKRKEDNIPSRKLVFFFNYKNFSYHFHEEGITNRSPSGRFRIETIKYLLKQGFNLPIY